MSDDHWIEKATKNKGLLHKHLGVPESKHIPSGKLEKAEHSKNPKFAKEANMAATLKAIKRKYGGDCY